MTPESERIDQLNDLPDIRFVRWVDGYRNKSSKALMRCDVDGFEWSASVHNLLNGCTGCPQCTGNRRWTAAERIVQLNALPNKRYVRWETEYRGAHSKAVMRCDVDGFEWSASVHNLVNGGTGCPRCRTK